jgi:hypothetical protein
MDCATAVLGAAGARQLLDRAKGCRNSVDLRAITGATVAPN